MGFFKPKQSGMSSAQKQIEQANLKASQQADAEKARADQMTAEDNADLAKRQRMGLGSTILSGLGGSSNQKLG